MCKISSLRDQQEASLSSACLSWGIAVVVVGNMERSNSYVQGSTVPPSMSSRVRFPVDCFFSSSTETSFEVGEACPFGVAGTDAFLELVFAFAFALLLLLLLSEEEAASIEVVFAAQDCSCSSS